jgi:hypothetical protein
MAGVPLRARGDLTMPEILCLRRQWGVLVSENIRYREACECDHLPDYTVALMGARVFRSAAAYKRLLIEHQLVQVSRIPPFDLVPLPLSLRAVAVIMGQDKD